MREKRVKKHGQAEPLFNFDDNFDEEQIYTFEIGELAFSDSELEEEDRLFKDTVAKLEAPNPPPPTFDEPNKDDPLHYQQFVGHHSRMERQERRMQILERQQLQSTAIQLKLDKERLESVGWESKLPHIVELNDVNDDNELTLKRQLALKEINYFLLKYEELCIRERKIKSKSRGGSVDDKDTVNSKSKSKQKSNSKSKAKPKAKPKPKPKKVEEVIAEYEEPEMLIEFRPMAFHYMLPKKLFPPKDFEISELMKTEVESYDLINELDSKKLKLQLRVKRLKTEDNL